MLGILVLDWLAYYHDQVAESRKIVAGLDLDVHCVREPDINPRWLLLHMIRRLPGMPGTPTSSARRSTAVPDCEGLRPLYPETG